MAAVHYLTKPVDNARLVQAVSRAERLRRLAVAKRMAMDVLGSTLPRAGDLAGLEQSLGSFRIEGGPGDHRACGPRGIRGLTSFAQLDPDVVKLDMTLLRDVEKTPIKAKLIQSLCAACRDLGVAVVAERIETVAERDCVIGLAARFSWGG